MIKLCTQDDFNKKTKGRRVILIGAGKKAKEIVDKFNLNIGFAVDNNVKGTDSCFWSARNISVVGWKQCIRNIKEDDILLVTPFLKYMELLKQIDVTDRMSDKDVYVYTYMYALQWDKERIEASNVPFTITKGKTEKIPRTIHYCWFSDDPYPDKVKQCIESWHKYCPDYEFKKWDLTNYETENQFCREALESRAWAFASDYLRCDVVEKYGGIYLDTDVELIKSLDAFLYDEGFFVFESKNGVDPGSGMGGVKGNDMLREIREQYKDISFIKEDGTQNRVSIIEKYTSILVKHGLKKNAQYQIIDGIAIYPPLVLSPYSYMTGIDSRYEYTYGIHHWISAWITEEQRKELDSRKSYLSNHPFQGGKS